MKKWWFLLVFISIISIVKSGQAIDLTKSNKEITLSPEKINESFDHHWGRTTIEKYYSIKMVKDINLPVKYANAYSKIEIQQKTGLPEPDPKIIRLIQKQAKEKSIQKEQPKTVLKPTVYLTFDDGPNQELDQILNILKAKKAKATFFMIEPQIKHYLTGVKRLVKEGHYPAIHSVTHDKNKLYASPIKMINEMEQTRKTILELTGVDSKIIRAPYGSKPYMKDPFRNVLVQHHMKMWDWNIDTMDWKYQRTNPHQILVNTINGLKRVNKNRSIVILMHVTKGTASVLPQIIDYLYSKGYQLPAYDPSKQVIMNFWNDGRL